MLNAVAGDDEQERMLAGMALVKAGERSLDLIGETYPSDECDAATGPTGCRYRWTTCTPDAHRDGRFSGAARGRGLGFTGPPRSDRQLGRIGLTDSPFERCSNCCPYPRGRTRTTMGARHCDLCLAGVDWMSPVACPNCQREVPELGSECPVCGPTKPNGSSGPPLDRTESRGYCNDAVASLSLAVASLLIWPLAILAVVYGLASIRASTSGSSGTNPRSGATGWRSLLLPSRSSPFRS